MVWRWKRGDVVAIRLGGGGIIVIARLGESEFEWWRRSGRIVVVARWCVIGSEQGEVVLTSGTVGAAQRYLRRAVKRGCIGSEVGW